MLTNEEKERYLDQYGLMQPDSDGSGNGLVYTAEYILALADNGCLPQNLREHFKRVYESCEVFPGVMRRRPDNTDQEGQDDYYGAALASMYFDFGALAKRIMHHGEMGTYRWKAEYEDAKKLPLTEETFNILSKNGKKNIKYVWNNVNPFYFTLSAWLGRYPQLITHIKYCANTTPTKMEQIAFIINLIVTSFMSKGIGAEVDPWIYALFMSRSGKGKNIPTDLAIKFFRWRFKKVWGNAGNLVAAYFQNNTHPLIRLLQNTD